MIEIILNSGLIGLIIALLGVLALGLILERYFMYRNETTPPEFVALFEDAVQRRDFAAAEQLCRTQKGNLAALYLIALINRDRGAAALRNILFREIDLTILPRLRHRLGLLSVIAKAAPMFGLLGTVQGMMEAFSTIAAASGAGVNPKDLAGDIGLALGTTFLGLVASLPIIFCTTWLRAKVDKFQLDLERYGQYCLDLFYNR
jgi:biopolymer transport protein ExbB/TolQ